MDSLRYFIIPATTAVGVLGFLLGGQYVWLGIGTFAVLLVFDVLLPRDIKPRQAIAVVVDSALYLQLPLLIGLYAAFAYSVAVGANGIVGAPGATSQLVGSLLSLVWLSAVPTLPVAHELMHRRHPFPRFVAKLLSTFYGDTNRDIAHVMTHHIHLDTALDSDTPRRGQTIYSFMLQATAGAYRDTWETEAQTLRRQGFSPWNWRNHLWMQLALQSAVPLLVGAFAGVAAGVTTLAAMFLSKMLLEAFNYFQHYGLLRVEGAAIEKHHAWNHLGMIARPLGAEITNHINHHLNGDTPFYALKPEPDAPQMPSLFLCFLAGIIPPLWFKFIAKPRLEDWDKRFASPQERELARQANTEAGWPQWLPTVV